MIQVYRPGNENFQKNGDVVLFCRSCEVEAKLNGEWHLDLDVPIDKEGRWKQVVEGAVLKVPTWQTDEQLYRIAKITKTEDGVEAVAYPIFFDSADDCFLLETRVIAQTGQGALNVLTANSPYSGQSNISKATTASFVRRNLMSAINGSGSPTFIEMWGGEILYDNYTIIINQRVGGDYGMEARYGRNIAGVSYEVDMSDIVTRIIPVAYNDHLMSWGNPWVDSPNINSYPKVYAKQVKYDYIRLASDAPRDTDGMVICSDQEDLDDALRAAAYNYFSQGVDTPKVTIDIDMAMVQSLLAEYPDPIQDENNADILDENSDQIMAVYLRNFAKFEEVRLGDTIRCRHYKLDITSTARVIALTWDCVRNRVAHVTLGDYKYDYIKDVDRMVNRVATTIRDDGSVMAERVRGFLDGAQTQLHTQYNLAEHQDVMAILFENLDEESPMYGALGIGTQGISISRTRTQDDRDWEWSTAITSEGILSPMIVTNTISGGSAVNWWDLQLGQISFQTISDDVNTRINTAIGTVDTDMTGIEICDAIFDDGAIRGFQTRTNPQTGDVEFYLSFDAMIGGECKLGGSNNVNGVLAVYDSNNNERILLNKDGMTVLGTSTYYGKLIIGDTSIDSCNKLYKTSEGKYVYGDAYDQILFDYESRIVDDDIAGGICISSLPIPSNVASGYRTTKVSEIMLKANTILLADATVSEHSYMACTRDTDHNTSVIAAYCTTTGFSDRRAKENIEDSSLDHSEVINNLHVVSFDWKDGRSPHSSAGFIAQEVKEVMPELVFKDGNGMYSINFIGIIPVLVGELQRQQARIESLESKLSEAI